jgi:hypothetical protein
MALPVRLKDVVEALEMIDNQSRAYISRLTGEIVVLTDEEEELVEEDVCEPELEDWQLEQMPKTREILESGEFLCLPEHFDIHEWDIMRRFAEDQSEMDREMLLDAIHGRGAFRMFKSTIHRLGIVDAWYKFRDTAIGEIAREWLEEEGIPYETSECGDPAE